MRFLSLLFFFAVGAGAQSPDTIYYDAHIYGGGSALAVRGGGIIATGNDADVLRLKSATTKLVDLHGAFVLPGFNDAHTHIAFAGQQHLTVDLDDVPSLAAMLAKVKAYAAGLPTGAWITGGGWDQTKWASKQLPTAADLDAVTGGHPTYLARTDGHIAVVNSAALTAAGVTAQTVAPDGSAIDHDAKGQPTGILREDAARRLVQSKVPPPDAAMRRRALEISLNDAAAHGVTSLQDYSEWADFLVLEQMEREGTLKVRVSEWLTFNDPVATLDEQRAHHDLHDPMLHTAMLKGFMDGSLGSRTAAMLAPYSDDPGNSGLPRYEQSKLDAMAKERAALGFQLGFHAIGDRANAMALDAYAAVDADAQDAIDQRHAKEVAECYAAHPEQRYTADGCGTMPRSRVPLSSTHRYRIEHAQVLAPGDFDRFEHLGVIASMQPSHLLTDMAWAGARLGPERSKYAYAWRSMLDHHVPLAFGTDYPVESINPFRGLYAAVTRANVDGTQVFHPEQRITLDEAIAAYTTGAAYAEFEETTKGKLAPGYWADFVVVDRDVTKATPQQLLHTRVQETVLGGRVVYVAPAGGAVETWRRADDE